MVELSWSSLALVARSSRRAPRPAPADRPGVAAPRRRVDTRISQFKLWQIDVVVVVVLGLLFAMPRRLASSESSPSPSSVLIVTGPVPEGLARRVRLPHGAGRRATSRAGTTS